MIMMVLIVGMGRALVQMNLHESAQSGDVTSGTINPCLWRHGHEPI